MALTPLHIQNVCLAGTQCRYLCWDNTTGNQTAFCMKKAPAYYKQICRDLLMYGVDLNERGDNCPGFILLKHTPQGYDVP